jgi:hypothetical protein
MKSTAVIALASAGFLCFPVLAQDSNTDGTTDHPQAPSVAKMRQRVQSQLAAHGTSSASPPPAVLQGDARQQTLVGWDVCRAAVETLTSWEHRLGLSLLPVMA